MIIWSAVATLASPSIFYLGNAGLKVLTDMHSSIEQTSRIIAGYEELRKQRELLFAHLNEKDSEHDKTLFDHEKRLSLLEGRLSKARIY